MKAGTKTLLFGVHNVLIHPFFVLIAWLIRYRSLPNLYEFFSILVHDLGLFGCNDLDGAEGEEHPERIYLWLLNRAKKAKSVYWKEFFEKAATEVIGHSRYYAAKHNVPLSKLFQADKLATGIYPAWLYILLGTLSGEIKEYMSRAKNGKYAGTGQRGEGSKLVWFFDMRSRCIIMGLDADSKKYLQNINHWNQK